MKTVTIEYIKDKHQDRISFIRLLIDFQPKLGLKEGKEMLDNMLDGKPIIYKVH